MRFADALRRVRRSCVVAPALVLALSVNGCADGLSPLTSANAPQELTALVLRPGAISLTWKPGPSANGAVRAYVIERRVNASGEFTEIRRIDPPFPDVVQWVDTDVLPETIYGYRVYALTSLGDRSPPSTIGGAITPPPPGILVETKSPVTSPESLDPDGYRVLIMGADTVAAAIGVSDKRRFAPLKPGKYTVSLSGLIDRCSVATPSQDVIVSDTLAATIAPVTFDVSCRDPNRGDIRVVVNQTGALFDPSVSIDVLGQAADTTLPRAERVYSALRQIPLATPTLTLPNLRPGTYTVSIKDIATNCALDGNTSRTATVTKLGTATVTYDIACRDTAPPPPVSNAPFVWRNKWNPRTAPAGASVFLETSLDLTARAGQNVVGSQGEIIFDPAVLRFEEAEPVPGGLPPVSVGVSVPGKLGFIASLTGNSAPRVGLVNIIKFRFTVIGANGAKSSTSTPLAKGSSKAGTNPSVPFDDSIRVVEDTFTVGTGSGGATNQPPVARAGGPYTGTAGTPLSLSGAGSTDADGTIAGYAWTFGDNTTGTGVSPSKTYAAAGTYSATLTVTDDKGATATSTAQVTISAANNGGGNTAPVARANGPYTATTGTPITLSSAGSTNATSFSWNLGNGQTATGDSPSVTYAAAGTFTITLTATGAGGQTATATATVTVTAPAPQPPPSPTTLVWKTFFGAFNPAVSNEVYITIQYDTRVNLTETPGAEALEKFTVDSLKWDPAVLQFSSINLGPNIVGNSNQVGAASGRLGLSGTISGAQQQGLISIATVKFRVIGARNASTTTKTFLGALIGPSSTNFYSYNSKTTITEGDFTVP
jgi:chitodextrinase